MVGDYRRVQDLVLVLARWLLVGALILAGQDAPEMLAPLPVLGGLGLYALFFTIAFVGGWAGTRLFAYLQSLGDLAAIAAVLYLVPGLGVPAYAVLLGVAVVIGLRRFPWVPALGYAVLASAVGFLAEQQGVSVLPGAFEIAVPGALVVAARLLAGDPLPDDYFERRPPIRTEQVRALQGLGRTLGERNELQPLLAETHRVILSQTGGHPRGRPAPRPVGRHGQRLHVQQRRGGGQAHRRRAGRRGAPRAGAA